MRVYVLCACVIHLNGMQLKNMYPTIAGFADLSPCAWGSCFSFVPYFFLEAEKGQGRKRGGVFVGMLSHIRFFLISMRARSFARVTVVCATASDVRPRRRLSGTVRKPARHAPSVT